MDEDNTPKTKLSGYGAVKKIARPILPKKRKRVSGTDGSASDGSEEGKLDANIENLSAEVMELLQRR